MKTSIATFALGALVASAAFAPASGQGTGGSPGKQAHAHGHAMMAMTCAGGYMLHPVAGSGEIGCARATSAPLGVVLTLNVTGEPRGALQPSHIHRGKCGSNGPVVLPLTNVRNGISSTRIAQARWTAINHTGLYINIHESAGNIPHVVSCANITAIPMR